ncbi:MAG: small ribosomal subunit biogenesis GTPase RsgA [Congregibacter sp.]
MSKRKLNRRQSWRIARKQQERGERAQRSEKIGAEALAAGELGAEQAGRVIARYGAQADVQGAHGVTQRCHLRANLGSLVAGDTVTFCAGESVGVIVARDDRQTALRRPDKFGKLRTVAANIDRVVIVMAPLPEPHGNLIDRYLVATENLGAEAVVLLNKTDLLADDKVAAAISDLLAPYPDLGYPVIRTQSKDGAIQELTALLKDHTSILVGQSGVGKTTLVNALLPEAHERVGELSPDRQKGRHTTTTARLFDLPAGGTLIDSPGIREFGLWHMSREDIEHGFREFRDRLGQCRFRDCRHQSEPGCALTIAIESGAIHPARLASYRHIVASLEETLQG